jgi:hypothetical protein
VQDRNPAEPLSQAPAEPEAVAEATPAASAAEALAEAVVEYRRAECKAALPRLLAVLYDPPSSALVRAILDSAGDRF